MSEIELEKRLTNLTLKLNNCLEKHYSIRARHETLREAYSECFVTNKYMFVKSTSDLVKAKDEYDNEFGKLLQTGATISGVQAKAGIIPINIKMAELMTKGGVNDNLRNKMYETIDECLTEIKRIEGYYEDHEIQLEYHRQKFNEVTQPRGN